MFQGQTLNATYNWLTRMTTDNCAFYNGAVNDGADNTNTVRTYFSNKYATNLEQMTGWSYINESMFDEVCEYIYF